MLETYKTYLAIISVALVTLSIRVVPVLFLAHRKIPDKINNVIIFLPTAILTSISVTEIMYNKLHCFLNIPISLPSAIFSFIVGYFTRSLFATILTSVIAYFVLQNI